MRDLNDDSSAVLLPSGRNAMVQNLSHWRENKVEEAEHVSASFLDKDSDNLIELGRASWVEFGVVRVDCRKLLVDVEWRLNDELVNGGRRVVASNLDEK